MNRNLASAVDGARTAYYQLVLLVGPHGSGKTSALRGAAADTGWPVVNLGAELARALVTIPSDRRPLAAQDALVSIVTAKPAATIAIDNIEILFEPSLKLQPLEVLKQLSRTTTLIVAWPGAHKQNRLTYGEPGRPEHISLDSAGLSVLSIESVSNR